MADIPRELLDAAYELVRTSKYECGPTPEDIARFALSRDKRAAEIVEAERLRYDDVRKRVVLKRAATAIETYTTAQEDGT